MLLDLDARSLVRPRFPTRHCLDSNSRKRISSYDPSQNPSIPFSPKIKKKQGGYAYKVNKLLLLPRSSTDLQDVLLVRPSGAFHERSDPGFIRVDDKLCYARIKNTVFGILEIL